MKYNHFDWGLSYEGPGICMLGCLGFVLWSFSWLQYSAESKFVICFLTTSRGDIIQGQWNVRGVNISCSAAASCSCTMKLGWIIFNLLYITLELPLSSSPWCQHPCLSLWWSLWSFSLGLISPTAFFSPSHSPHPRVPECFFYFLLPVKAASWRYFCL